MFLINMKNSMKRICNIKSRVITVGGTKKKVSGIDRNEMINVGKEKNPVIRITGADKVF